MGDHTRSPADLFKLIPEGSMNTQQISLQSCNKNSLEVKPRAVSREGTERHARPDMARAVSGREIARP